MVGDAPDIGSKIRLMSWLVWCVGDAGVGRSGRVRSKKFGGCQGVKAPGLGNSGPGPSSYR